MDRAALAELEHAYARALRRACDERSGEAIAAAFDEADRLQHRLLVATRRRRAHNGCGRPATAGRSA